MLILIHDRLPSLFELELDQVTTGRTPAARDRVSATALGVETSLTSVLECAPSLDRPVLGKGALLAYFYGDQGHRSAVAATAD